MESAQPFEIWFEPLLAFRNMHELTRSNLSVNKKFERADNGIGYRLYNGFTNLFVQFSRKVEYVASPDWFYNVEYPRENERGYNFHEDLYRPGYFKLKLAKGNSVIVSSGLEEVNSQKLSVFFNKTIKNNLLMNSVDNYLENAAQLQSPLRTGRF